MNIGTVRLSYVVCTIRDVQSPVSITQETPRGGELDLFRAIYSIYIMYTIYPKFFQLRIHARRKVSEKVFYSSIIYVFFCRDNPIAIVDCKRENPVSVMIGSLNGPMRFRGKFFRRRHMLAKRFPLV
jgi:hypothetical protein